MPTEFNDDVHFALFKGAGAIRTGNSYEVRWSEITLAALRSAGFLDNMIDGTTPPVDLSLLWLDKNTDPATLKEWNPVGSNWEQVTSQTLFGRVPWRGAWAAPSIYRVGDIVSYQGAIWIAVQTSQNHIPAEDAYWDLFIPVVADDAITDAKIGAGVIIQPVDTRTTLKGLSTSRRMTAYLREAGREGVFAWKAGNYSALVAADTLEGIYVKSTATAASAGAWVRQDGWHVSGINPEWFGAVSGDGTASFSTDSADAFIAAFAVAAIVGAKVTIPTGFYLSSKRLSIPSGIIVEGLGTNEAWELPFFDLASATITLGVTVCFTGTGTRNLTLDYCSAMHHSGAYRTNPVRSYTNAFDQYFEATDFTSGNASGTTKATLKLFSAAIVLGEDGLSGKTILRNIRAVPACNDGVNGPLGGYLLTNANAYVPWDEWDVGVLDFNPYTSVVEDCQFSGYWHMKGAVQTSIRTGNTQSGGRGEMGIWQRDWFQGGIAIRNGDFYPVLSKTGTSVTVAWSPGHRFDTAGSIFIDSVSYTYTGLVYSATGEGTLEFTGIVSTTNVVVSGDDRSIVHMTNNNGTTQTVFRDNNIRDFWHASLVERPSTAFGAQAGQYSAALELVGYPIRGVTFENNTIYTREPLFLLQIGARDIFFDKGTQEEKDYRTSLGGSLNPDGAYQALAIVGPDAAHAANWPVLQMGGISLSGYPWSGRLNTSPVGLAVSGRRYSAFTDCFNPFYFDPGNLYGKGAGIYDRRAPRRYIVNAGVLTIDDELCAVDTEASAATDEVDTVTVPLWINRITLYPYNSGRITTYKHATGNLNLLGYDVRVGGGQSITLRKVGTGLVIENEYETRYIEGTAAYAGGAIADGAGVDVFVTVTGAALGDLAIATLNQNLLGCMLTATVTAANTVRVRIQNEAGGSLSPTAGTVRARVYK